jgi:hypothetical protein
MWPMTSSTFLAAFAVFGDTSGSAAMGMASNSERQKSMMLFRGVAGEARNRMVLTRGLPQSMPVWPPQRQKASGRRYHPTERRGSMPGHRAK